jgi:thioredoxin
MDQINRLFNAIAIAVVVSAGGYLIFGPSGPWGMPKYSEPQDAWFRAAVLERSQPVVVKFGAPWCGPCRMLDPELDRLADHGRVAVVKIDIGQHPELAQHYGVSAITDVFLFHHGAVVAHRVGYAGSDDLRQWVERCAAETVASQ